MKAESQPALTPAEFEVFRTFIERESGIALDEGKAYLLETRLRKLLLQHGCRTYGDLLRKATVERAPQLQTRIIDAITTNETLWFRDAAPYVVLEEVFLPEMLRQVAVGKPRVRIWSAACSTGQEPYSIAMVIHEFCERAGQGVLTPAHFEILATDISTEALAIARTGAYDGLAMSRGMTDRFQARYFKQNQRVWLVDPRLKGLIDFREFNLQRDFTGLGAFDVIFCRNVAIYFSHEFKAALFARMKAALRPGGLFFLGTSETMAYFYDGFRLKEHGNATYYQA